MSSGVVMSRTRDISERRSMNYWVAAMRMCWGLMSIVMVLLGTGCTRGPICAYSDPIVRMPSTLAYGKGHLPRSGQENPTDHVREAERLLQRHPNEPKILNDVGIIRAANGDLGSGAELLDRAHKMAPDDPTITYNDALLTFQQGNVQESIRLTRDALQDDPEMSEARVALAAMSIEQTQYDNAAKTIGKLPADQARTVEADLVRGAIQLSQRHVDEAIGSFQDAIQLDLDNAIAQFDLGCAYLAQNQMGQAEDNFRSALDKDPGLAAAHNNLGTLFARSGNQAGAAWEYRQAAELSPGNRLFANNLSNMTAQAKVPPSSKEGNIEPVSVASSVSAHKQSPSGNRAAFFDDTRDTEATQRAIDRIRKGPHEPMPVSESHQTGGEGSSVAVENRTTYQIHVYFAGPVNQNLRVSPGETRTISVIPGQYSIAADVPDSGILPCYGVQNYAVGVQYAERFVVGRAH